MLQSCSCLWFAKNFPGFLAAKIQPRAVVLGIALLAMLAYSPAASVFAQTPTPVLVPTWRYDLTHAGQNTNETELTPAVVNPKTFGKLFSLSVDSTVYAQPLYVPGLTMSDGQVHNVLFVATENDSVYAFDADSNGGANSQPLWKITLLDAAHGAGPGATAVPAGAEGIAPQGDIGPTIGVTGTPVINSATNTMYVVGNSKENGVYFSRLHAINILTGAEQTRPVVQTSPVAISATVAGTGIGSSGGQLAFNPLIESQRPALNYYNGSVYIGYAAHGDIGPWHGWLFAYNATTMQQTAALCLSPNLAGGGVWASGAGLPIDDDAAGGRMFVVTGNGKNQPTYPPFGASADMNESIIDFSLANGGLTPVDAFTSFNSDTLNDRDLDQGSGGILMVPDQQGTNPHILVQAGKEGRILVLNRDSLGGNQTGAASNATALQDIPGQIKGMWSTPAYWNGNVYMWPSQDYPKLFKLTNGVLSSQPASTSNILSAFPGPSFSISSNGTQDGIAWAVRADQYVTYGSAVLYAWPADDLTTPLYESDTNAARDNVGIATKFSIPVVTNGKVYVVANRGVSVYGLLNGVATAAAPVITPDGGTFTAGQSVSLSTSSSGAQIYYTLDGSTPTPASTLYTGPISITTDTEVSAIASGSGYVQSAISSANFTFSSETPQVAISPAAGTYAPEQQVTLTDSDPSATIYYTTDGSVPSASSAKYTGPITLTVSETINATAIDPSLANSDLATAAYLISAGGQTINFANGFSSTTGLTLNGSVRAANDSRMQLTDGGLNEAGSVFWNTPINTQAFTTQFTFQLSLAQANGFTFTLQNNGATAIGGDAAGLGYAGIGKSVAVKFNIYDYQGEGNDSTGVYTNGAMPTLPTVDISPSGIELNSDDGLTATLTYDGTALTLNLVDGVTNDTFTTSQAINIPQVIGSNTAYVGFTGASGGLSASQKLTSWTYTTQALPPAFSPAAGRFSSAQSVVLSSGTADAVIYYTTDGTTPTAASAVYNGPITVGQSKTISAIAISRTMGTSAVETAQYQIQPPQTFSIAASQQVTLIQGGSATATIIVTPNNGFTGTVALACTVTSGPAGATTLPTCSAAQAASVAGATPVTDTVTINTSGGTSLGSYTATVTGTSGALTEATNVEITVVAPAVSPSFTVSGTAVEVTAPGASGTSTITLTPNGGFAGNIALTCAITASPAGAANIPSCSVAQPGSISGTAPVTSTLTIASQAGTSPGAYTATVAAASGTQSETTTLAVTIDPVPVSPAFTVSGTAVQVTSPGSSGTSAITLTPSGGFTGSVALTCAIAASPAGAANLPSCSATQPALISGSAPATSTLIIASQVATPPGSYTATVTAVSGSLSETTAIEVTIEAATAPATFSLSGTTISVASAGGTGTSTISITPSGGFTGAVGVSCAITSSPADAADIPSCSMTQPAAISGSNAVTSTLTITTTAASTAALHSPFKGLMTFGGGGTLVAFLMFGLPLRRRKWQTLFSLLLLSAMAVTMMGCGNTYTPPVSRGTGTTPGSYTVTVTGASGSVTAKIAVSVIVE